MQARGLREAAALLDMPALLDVAERTEALAAGWNALAETAPQATADASPANLQRRVRDLEEEEIATRQRLISVL